MTDQVRIPVNHSHDETTPPFPFFAGVAPEARVVRRETVCFNSTGRECSVGSGFNPRHGKGLWGGMRRHLRLDARVAPPRPPNLRERRRGGGGGKIPLGRDGGEIQQGRKRGGENRAICVSRPASPPPPRSPKLRWHRGGRGEPNRRAREELGRGARERRTSDLSWGGPGGARVNPARERQPPAAARLQGEPSRRPRSVARHKASGERCCYGRGWRWIAVARGESEPSRRASVVARYPTSREYAAVVGIGV